MSERQHALLSASTAHRWLYCTPSARLEQEEGIEECSVYAEEGTAAHALAEIKLSYLYGKIGPIEYQEKLRTWHDTEVYEKYYTKEFEEFVDDYISFVTSQTDALTEENKKFYIYFEVRVNFSNIVPQGFGTSDVIVVTEDMVHVIDLKFGQGVPVSAINNPQLRLYGLGALNLFPNSKQVKMSINQPRLASCDTEILTKKELLDWAFNFVRPRAEEAIKGEGALQASEKACKFCKVRAKCKARADQQLALAQKEFEVVDLKANIAKNMTPERISQVLEIAPAFIDWFKDVQAYALGQLMQGVEIPGFKLVEGRSIRQITDEEKVKEILVEAGFKEKELMTKPALLGISSLEKVVGKKNFADLCADYIIKPHGKLTLAPENDRRPAVNTLQVAQLEFAEPIKEDNQ